MKTRKFWTRCIAQIMIAAMLLCLLPMGASAESAIPDCKTVFTFTEAGVTAAGDASGYTINGAAVEISAPGAYKFTGVCANGAISVKDETSDVAIVLQDLTLTCTAGAPLTFGKKCAAAVYLQGTVALKNATVRVKEDKKAENTEKTEEAKAQKPVAGAAIFLKANAKVTIDGNGMLFLGNAGKNAIRLGKNAKLTVSTIFTAFSTKRVQGKRAQKKTDKQTPAPETPAPENPTLPVEPTPEEPAAAAEEPAAAEPEAAGADATVTAKKAAGNKSGKNFKDGKFAKNGKNVKKFQPIQRVVNLNLKAGDAVAVKDEAGNILYSGSVPVDAKCAIFVSAALAGGQNYKLFVNEKKVASATARTGALKLAAPNAMNGKKLKKQPQKGNAKKNADGKEKMTGQSKNAPRGSSKKQAKDAAPEATPAA